MRAVIFTEYGAPEVLQVGDVPAPHAGPGQVRIAVRGAGGNPIDWKQRSGAMREFPGVDGREAAGVVDEVGEGGTDGAEPTTCGDGLVERVRPFAPDGVDFAFDTAGKGGIQDLIELTGDPARVATIADFSAGQHRAADAHRAGEGGHVRGKLVLVP